MKYPQELQSLIDSKKWPTQDSQLKGITTNIKLLKMFPEESGNLVLSPPPFATMTQEAMGLKSIRKKSNWVDHYLSVDNPDDCIIVGWFGYGADTALIVDCSTDNFEMKKYIFNSRWKRMGTFKEFSEKLNLKDAQYKKYEL